MQIANVLLALNGDRRNTVPKYGVTVAEVEVMRAIHGVDAVHEIEVLDKEVDRSPRVEADRLALAYFGKDSDGKSIVRELYKGTATNMPHEFDELGLDESLFKVMARAAPPPPAPKRRGRPKKTAAEAPAPKPAANSADHFFDDEGGDDVSEPTAAEVME